MRYQFVKQDGIKDCGVACLLMIIRTYKGGCSKEYLRNLTHTTKDGTTAYDLLNAGEKFHFTTKGLRGDVEKLEEEYFPVIAHVVIDNIYQHFVVIYAMNLKKKELVIADPAVGIRKVSIEEFRQISTNQFLIFIPNKPILKINMQHPIQKNIFTFIKKKFAIFILIFFLSFFYTAISILLTFYFQILLNRIEVVFLDNLYFYFLVLFLVFALLKILIQNIRIHILVKITHDFDSYLFNDVYHHLFTLPDSYYQNRTTGEVLARITDLNTIKDILSKFILNIAFDLFLAIVSLVILFKINYSLTMILFLFSVLVLILFIKYRDKIQRKTAELKESYAKMHSFLTDSIYGVFSIKHLKREKYMEDVFNKKYSDYLNKSIDYHKFWNKNVFFQNLSRETLQLILTTLGCYLIYQNKMNIAEFMTYLFLTSYFLSPLENIYDFALDFQNQREAFNRIKEFYLVEKQSIGDNVKINKIESLKLQDIYFSYRKQDNVLKHVNISFYKNDKVLIYGKSGSGKSTLIKILAGYLEDYDGNIYINDKLLKENICGLLQKSITYVSQNEELLNMSVKENILLGRKIDEDKFKYICNLLQIDKFVSKNFLAYDMLIEENGANLSGGERQRIVLARSILRDTDIYIFDESLCNMDIILERKILENLFRYLDNKIVIVVSHRFYNQDLYSRRIELQEGEIYADISSG